MEYREGKSITPEEAVVLWQTSWLSLPKTYGKTPEILKVHSSVIGTLDNFNAPIGKAKSKKAFNVSVIAAAALTNGIVLQYTAALPEDRRKTLYVGTEQSPYHRLKVARHILRMAGFPTDRDNENLEFLVLRKYIPEERITIVEQATYRTDNIGLTIIDSIRDMVYGINSPSEATCIISELIQWVDEKQICIRTILHQNKADENVRGHIGTELNNKTETVLLVEKGDKDTDVSTVRAAHIRAMDFEVFVFRINEEALPELLDEYKFQRKEPGRPRKEKFDAYRDIAEQQHRIILETTLTLRDEYDYQELAEALKDTCASVGVPLSDNKVVSLITMLKSKRMIVQESGGKYRFMPGFHY